MESIDKLREFAEKAVYADNYIVGSTFDLNRIADEIEREIAERFMELPVDADGVPIHVGDELETAHGGKVIVEYVGECEVRVYRDGQHYRISQDEYAYTCSHVKPRTVEDILALFLTAVGDDDPHYYDEQIAEYADVLRNMVVGE